MAVTDNTLQNPSKGAPTERGYNGWKQFLVVVAATTPVYCLIDTLNIGGAIVTFFVDNLNASGGSYGAVGLGCILQVSNDNNTWVDVAFKDETGADVASTGVTCSANSTKWIIAGTSHPAIGARFFRLKLTPASGSAESATITVTVK